MRVEDLGEGDDRVAVIGGIHGDEPCGPTAIERVRSSMEEPHRPVRFIIAHEEAIEAGVRYLEADLNRVFPGDPDGETIEERLAASLTTALNGALTLSLHSTQSTDRPFAIVEEPTAEIAEVCSALPVDAVVETGPYSNGRLFDATPTIEIECGKQGTERAADNAEMIVRAFLAATGVVDAPVERRQLPVYRLKQKIPKRPAEEYEVFVDHLEAVEAGDVIASADGQPTVAEEDFFPVLLSAYGYRDVFGFQADRVGTIEPAES